MYNLILVKGLKHFHDCFLFCFFGLQSIYSLQLVLSYGTVFKLIYLKKAA